MAEPYLKRLSQMVDRLELPGMRLGASAVTLESKHFFSGAALYANGKICAVLGPAGLAIKLPADVRESLLKDSKGTPFRFFPNGPIKREYVLTSNSMYRDDRMLKNYLNLSVSYVEEVRDSALLSGRRARQ